MPQRQMTLLRNFQVLPLGSEECCVLEMQATIKEKRAAMLLFGPSLREKVQEMKQGKIETICKKKLKVAL